jgi:ribulose-5-phosphate 4-epimerase/fuculose-1-phosphate aldolase
MACQWNPESVSPTLLNLTTSLDVREKDFVILAEGNTSELRDDNHIVVKASGARMGNVTTKDFVVAEISSLVELMDSVNAGPK